MDEIHAESCRMLRDSAVSIPYHRPKNRSLEEFLSRKKGVRDAIGGDIKIRDVISSSVLYSCLTPYFVFCNILIKHS